MENKIELRPVTIPYDYCQKWNIHLDDFCHLYVNGKKVSPYYFRVGGFGAHLDRTYFLVMKHVEAFYDDSITTDKKRKPHLKTIWVIIDNNGVIKAEFEGLNHAYLQGGIIYAINSEYYNIETGEFYGKSYKSMGTDQYLFIHNEYDKDESKRGILKIDKADGSVTFYPNKTN